MSRHYFQENEELELQTVRVEVRLLLEKIRSTVAPRLFCNQNLAITGCSLKDKVISKVLRQRANARNVGFSKFATVVNLPLSTLS